MIRYGLILLTICLCASLVLSVTYQFTHSRIEAQLINEEKESLDEVFPGATEFEQKDLGGRNYYLAKSERKDLGYIINAKTKGYGGEITMLVGFDFTGEIKGIKILTQSETPGLGAKINEVRYGEGRPWFLRQFESKNAKDLELGKNIQAITSATISSRAVLDGVKKEIAEFLSRVRQ
jgi:electron transport complex protein RnfG